MYLDYIDPTSPSSLSSSTTVAAGLSIGLASGPLTDLFNVNFSPLDLASAFCSCHLFNAIWPPEVQTWPP
ncbi:uncharacterized protein ARMOST_19424 [Armillaria ostoyae]|uniref:Uncharacterized protein n=1 Tax=Armillaria ostoyae TaxID=47428 RepID=A0A284S4L8_ARMOS|nr:uncharacterized protein ARMOST_19417 [Armillaria ostoyae]SJL15916.1 uncharacterized protein ARMOST_19424 [Armillaria ostoyae]